MLKPVISFFLFQIWIITAVYSQSDSVTIGKITVTGNKITNSSVIFREIGFIEGDLIKRTELNSYLQRAECNLLNLSLFNFVNSQIIFPDSQNIEVNFVVEERWYIWPYPIFEHADRNFNNYIKEKDWDRINYGGYLEIENFRGRRENLIMKARYGFKEQYSLTYKIPFFDKKKHQGLEFTFSSFRQKIVPYNTIENKLIYLSDNNRYLKRHIYSGISYSYRKKIKTSHNLSLYYNRIFVEDTILISNSNYSIGNRNDNLFCNMSYNYIIDDRNLKYYPTEGYYFEFNLQNILYKDVHNKNIQLVTLNFNRHFNISEVLFYSGKIKMSRRFGVSPSWLFSNALGYEEYMRGYEYYVIDGSDYYILDQSLRYRLFPVQIKHFRFIPLSKFQKVHYVAYAGIFFDSGYISDRDHMTAFNELSDRYIYSFGAGIDLITYYDRMLRLEYSFNKLNQSGVYLHFEKYF